ncbi:MAG: heavy-metal-associated domain-containing protein [Verrucomicrobiota bacterium]
MKTLTTSIVLILAVAGMAVGAEKETKHRTVVTTVNGMVCSFCAQGIEKHFKKDPSVAKVYVNLGKKAVVLEEKSGKKIADESIKKAVTNAGFKVVRIERPTKTFDEVVKAVKAKKS